MNVDSKLRRKNTVDDDQMTEVDVVNETGSVDDVTKWRQEAKHSATSQSWTISSERPARRRATKLIINTETTARRCGGLASADSENYGGLAACSHQPAPIRCNLWRRSVVKYGVRVSQVKPSNCFGRLEKNSFTFHFGHKSFILDDVKLAELSNNSFEWKDVTV